MKIKSKGKVSKFSVFLLIVTLLATTAALVAYNKLWDFLEGYHDDEAPPVIEFYMNILKSKDYDRIFELNNIELTEFNTHKSYVAKLTEMFGEDFEKLEYSLVTSDGTTEVYEIISPNGVAQTVKIHLNAEGEYTIETERIETPYSLSVTVPSGSEVYINDILLDEKYLLSDTYSIEEYGSMDEPSMPEFVGYSVNNLLYEPTCNVAFDGEDLELIVDDDLSKISARKPVSAENSDALSAIIEETAVKYAMYITQDIGFEVLSPYLLEKSQFYRSIKGYSNEWYAEHEFSYDNVDVSNIILYDDTHFSANISFTYHIIRPVKTYDYDVQYKMFFIKDDNSWKLVTLA